LKQTGNTVLYVSYVTQQLRHMPRCTVVDGKLIFNLPLCPVVFTWDLHSTR